MLEQILNHLHNYFEVNRITGTFVIEGGAITLPSIIEGQYYWIGGSIFNNGLHRYNLDCLQDETFDGIVIACAIPKALLDLVSEIEDWCAKYGDAVNSPYQSESFGGYSYSKGSAADGNSASWQSAFRARLNPWRKI